MLETILQKDKEILIFLNNLGSEHWDWLWLIITKQLNWIPLFLLILYLIFKKFGFKKGGFILLSIVILITFSDQFTNLIKNTVQRLRPNNDPEIKYLLRNFINPRSFSFVSGHATTSTFFTVFIVLLFKPYYKKIIYLLFFPLIFGYSRIYLGVHYPIDVFCGFLIGAMLAILYFKLFHLIFSKIFS